MFKSKQALYKSKDWRNLKDRLILERGLFCEYCGTPIGNKSDCIAHHKQELTIYNVNDYNISLNPDNIMLVHFSCHNEIHNRYGSESSNRKVYIVYGPPLSGKSSFVKRVAQPNDIVVDIDSIYQMITNNPRYFKTDRIADAAFKVERTLIYEIIKQRFVYKWQTAFIIGGYPLLMDRERLIDELGAEEILIDATKDDCLERLYKDPERYPLRDKWEQYINDWFNKYQPTD